MAAKWDETGSPTVFDDGPMSDIGDPDTEAAIAAMFLEDATVRLGELAEAIEQGDAERLGTIAHRLKGSAASVGAVSVSALSDELCGIARERSLQGARAVHERLTGALRDTDAAIHAYLARAG